MYQLINSIITEFAGSFKRKKTWQWFSAIVMGFMLRSNHRGITSIVAALWLKPSLYHTMLHFFRSTGYKAAELYDKWIKIAIRYANVKRVAGRVVLLGDHIKIPKEGLRMPDVRAMHQDSSNSGKPDYIEGHMYAHVGAVITNGKVSRSLPLSMQMQSSPPRIEGTKKPNGDTLVTQMLKLVHETAKSIASPVVVALDAYFSSKLAWAAADDTVTETGERMVEIVTRAQTNTVAYTVPASPAGKKNPVSPASTAKKSVYMDSFPIHPILSKPPWPYTEKRRRFGICAKT